MERHFSDIFPIDNADASGGSGHGGGGNTSNNNNDGVTDRTFVLVSFTRRLSLVRVRNNMAGLDISSPSPLGAEHGSRTGAQCSWPLMAVARRKGLIVTLDALDLPGMPGTHQLEVRTGSDFKCVVTKWLPQSISQPCALSVNGSGTSVAITQRDGTVALLSLSDSDSYTTLKDGAFHPLSTHWLLNTDRLVSGCRDGTVVVWQASLPTSVWSARVHSSSIAATGVSPDGRFVVTGCKAGTAVLWRMGNLTPSSTGDAIAVDLSATCSDEQGKSPILCIAVADDSERAAWSTAAGSIWLANLTKASVLWHKPMCPGVPVVKLAFICNNYMLAVLSTCKLRLLKYCTEPGNHTTTVDTGGFLPAKRLKVQPPPTLTPVYPASSTAAAGIERSLAVAASSSAIATSTTTSGSRSANVQRQSGETDRQTQCLQVARAPGHAAASARGLPATCDDNDDDGDDADGVDLTKRRAVQRPKSTEQTAHSPRELTTNDASRPNPESQYTRALDAPFTWDSDDSDDSDDYFKYLEDEDKDEESINRVEDGADRARRSRAEPSHQQAHELDSGLAKHLSIDTALKQLGLFHQTESITGREAVLQCVWNDTALQQNAQSAHCHGQRVLLLGRAPSVLRSSFREAHRAFVGEESPRPEDLQPEARELLILLRVRHPNIAAFLGLLPSADTTRGGHIVMEMPEAGSLYELLHVRSRAAAWLPRTARLRMLAQVASALSFLHDRHICHTNVQSACIHLTQALEAKVTGLGRARFYHPHSRAVIGDARWKHPWSSPEQLLELQEASHILCDTDVFSFGALVWEVLVDAVPWSFLPRSGDQLLGAIATEYLHGRRLPLAGARVGGSLLEMEREILFSCFKHQGQRADLCQVQNVLLAAAAEPSAPGSSQVMPSTTYIGRVEINSWKLLAAVEEHFRGRWTTLVPERDIRVVADEIVPGGPAEIMAAHLMAEAGPTRAWTQFGKRVLAITLVDSELEKTQFLARIHMYMGRYRGNVRDSEHPFSPLYPQQNGVPTNPRDATCLDFVTLQQPNTNSPYALLHPQLMRDHNIRVQRVFHGAGSLAAASSILQGGFARTVESRLGRQVYGAGVYFTPDLDEALRYAEAKPLGAEATPYYLQHLSRTVFRERVRVVLVCDIVYGNPFPATRGMRNQAMASGHDAHVAVVGSFPPPVPSHTALQHVLSHSRAAQAGTAPISTTAVHRHRPGAGRARARAGSGRGRGGGGGGGGGGAGATQHDSSGWRGVIVLPDTASVLVRGFLLLK